MVGVPDESGSWADGMDIVREEARFFAARAPKFELRMERIELEQIGALALAQALPRARPGPTWRSFIRVRVRGAISDALRHWWHWKRGEDRPGLDLKNVSFQSRGQQPAVHDPGFAEADARDEIHNLLSIFEPRTRKVLLECLGRGRPNKDVAEELGVSQSRVSQIIGRSWPLLLRWAHGETHESIDPDQPPIRSGGVPKRHRRDYAKNRSGREARRTEIRVAHGVSRRH